MNTKIEKLKEAFLTGKVRITANNLSERNTVHAFLDNVFELHSGGAVFDQEEYIGMCGVGGKTYMHWYRKNYILDSSYKVFTLTDFLNWDGSFFEKKEFKVRGWHVEVAENSYEGDGAKVTITGSGCQPGMITNVAVLKEIVAKL